MSESLTQRDVEGGSGLSNNSMKYEDFAGKNNYSTCVFMRK